MIESGTGKMVHYPTPTLFQPAYAELNYKPGNFQISEVIYRAVLRQLVQLHSSVENAAAVAALGVTSA